MRDFTIVFPSKYHPFKLSFAVRFPKCESLKKETLKIDKEKIRTRKIATQSNSGRKVKANRIHSRK